MVYKLYLKDEYGKKTLLAETDKEQMIDIAEAVALFAVFFTGRGPDDTTYIIWED